MVKISAILLLAACLYLTVETTRGERVIRLISKFISFVAENLPKTRGNIREVADLLLLDALPILFEQKPANEKGKLAQYGKFLFRDHSNDEIVFASIVDIIKRSGFGVETHKVTSDDGYTTILFRVVNPLADRKRLKRPPVMMMHGGTIDPSTFLWASAKQHHPEKYPRTAEDWPITSSNRSLGFFLANNGYDVWLVTTRGANVESSRLDKIQGSKTLFKDMDLKNMTLNEGLAQSATLKDFWSFSFDEVMEHEMPRQLDKILEVTGAKNVTLFGFSLSALTTLPWLGSRPDIAKNKVHNFINMAPLLNNTDSNLVFRLVVPFALATPTPLGKLFFTRLVTSPLTQRLIVTLARSMELRYTLIKAVLNLMSGASAKYHTVLELPVLGHLLQKIPFEQVQHMCQILRDQQYQKFDHGPVKNKLIYGTAKPPVYDVSDIFVKNWMLISATNDNASPNSTIQQVLRVVNPKPVKHLVAKDYNHIDLVSAVDNDVQVNRPILEFLDEFAY